MFSSIMIFDDSNRVKRNYGRRRSAAAGASSVGGLAGRYPAKGANLSKDLSRTWGPPLTSGGRAKDFERLIENARKLPYLDTLKLSASGITDKDLAGFWRIRSLRDVELLKEEGVSSAGWKTITNLQGLRRLEVYDTPLADQAIQEIGQLNRLESLCLNNVGLTDALALRLANLKGIKRLCLVGDLSDEGIGVVQNFRDLEDLSLKTTRMSASAFASLAALQKLRRLFVDAPNLNGVELGCLGLLQNLKELEVKCVSLNSDGLKGLEDMLQLEKLEVSSEVACDAKLPSLGNLKHLKIINISNAILTDDELAFVSEVPQLQQISFNARKASSSGFKRLQNLKGLDFISVRELNTTIEVQGAIRSIPNWSHLEIIGDFDQEAIKHLDHRLRRPGAQVAFIKEK